MNIPLSIAMLIQHRISDDEESTSRTMQLQPLRALYTDRYPDLPIQMVILNREIGRPEHRRQLDPCL